MIGKASHSVIYSPCEGGEELEEEMTSNELSLMMDLILSMIRNGHIDELTQILEKYQKSDLLDRALIKP